MSVKFIYLFMNVFVFEMASYFTGKLYPFK